MMKGEKKPRVIESSNNSCLFLVSNKFSTLISFKVKISPPSQQKKSNLIGIAFGYVVMYFLFLVVALFFSSDQLSNLTYIILWYNASIYFIYPIDYCYIFLLLFWQTVLCVH